jgi:hypothetical protein
MSEPIPAEEFRAGKPVRPGSERLALYPEDPALRRRIARTGLLGTAIVAVVVGAIAVLIGGWLIGLLIAALVAFSLLYMVLVNVRKRLWIENGAVIVRKWRSRRVDLSRAKALTLVVTDIRGTRSVGLVATPARRGRTVTIDLACYSGVDGLVAAWELELLPMRRLADALMNNVEANGIVFAELLIAQLRSEAQGAETSEKPLFRLAFTAPRGRLTRPLSLDSVSRFVADLH